MTNMEIALNMLAEASAAELSKQRNPQGFNQQKRVAKDGGSVANFYKVKDANHIVLIDSFGNDPQKEDKKNYILKRKRV